MSLKQVRLWFARPSPDSTAFEHEKLIEESGLHVGTAIHDEGSCVCRGTTRKRLSFSNCLKVVAAILLAAALVFNTKSYLAHVQEHPTMVANHPHSLDSSTWTFKGYNASSNMCTTAPVDIAIGTTKTPCTGINGLSGDNAVAFDGPSIFTLCLYRNGNCSPTQYLGSYSDGGVQCGPGYDVKRYKVVVKTDKLDQCLLAS